MCVETYQTRYVSNFFISTKQQLRMNPHLTQIFRNGYQIDDGDCMIILSGIEISTFDKITNSSGKKHI